MLAEKLEDIREDLAEAMPTRVVTRDFLDFAQRSQVDLEAGTLTIITQRESRYANYRGREADLGRMTLAVVGQLKLPEDALPSLVEDAEFAFAEEVKDWLQGVLPVNAVDLIETRFSGQMDAPYGWFAMTWEVLP
ncbi:MAG: hypothetical protein IPG16_02315 [Comamonadaceae bacterium]|nr:hypothetical protein [Comamonadaceae bacterium]